MAGKSLENRNRELIGALKTAAVQTGNVDVILEVLDLEQAGKPTEEPNLTGTELAKLLGVKLDDEGLPVDMTEMLNACIHVQTNDAVNILPQPERIKAIRTAAALLDHLHG